MTIQEINRAYNHITELLDQRELKDAFISIHGLITGVQAFAFLGKLNEMQDTYMYMLRYRLDGTPDPTRTQIHHSLLAAAYELADQVRHAALQEVSPLAFYTQRRNRRITPLQTYRQLHLALEKDDDSTPDNAPRFDQALVYLYINIWISDPLTADEVLDIKEILLDDDLPYYVGCQIVSALWMGLQTAFDREKLLLLFDALYLPEERVRVRALISILLTLYLHRKRTGLYPQIADRLAAAGEVMPALTRSIRTIILRFILSRETEKITRKLQEEIIPEMMKLSPKLNQKINLKDFSEQLGDDMNPEWQEIFGDSQLGKKMEEFSELQQEGADVMHSTFIHLKSFPFFREMANWFLPFVAIHSALGKARQEGGEECEAFDRISTASFMCNSDKYSLSLSILQMPEAHRRMMISHFTGQIGEFMEQQRQELATKQDKIETIAGQYIQDMYRFYKLYPGRLEFEDIFALPLDFHNLPVLRPYIADDESLMIIAEYYLHKNYPADALPLYEQLIAKDPENDVLYQKTGFCRQTAGDLPGALADYRHADLLRPDSKWVIRRLAGCHRSMKQAREALKYYYRLEAMEPDNLSVQLNIGHCLLEEKEYAEALKYYYKVDYLDTKGNKAWRPIAWTSFLTGRYEQARNYYQKILASQPTLHDYLNAGHTEWALQHIREAVDCYKQAVAAAGGNLDKFIEQFNQDIPELLAAGIETGEIPLMLDQLRYALADAF